MGSQAPLGTKDLFATPGAELPGFVREVARALMRNGKSKSTAIAIAISQIKKWAAGGGGVNADTQAKAARALAQWEAAKAKAHATPNKRDMANPVYAPGRVVLLARAPEPAAKKEKKGADKSKLPPGATGWKHGWVPVDSSGKPVGPAQPPGWFKDAQARHKAAGGRTVDQINAEKLKNAQDARARKAEAPKKKAEAEAKHKERAAEQTKRETERKEKAADRAKEQKAREKERLIQSAYKQALADRKNGRELSEQQRRVVAYVEAKQKKDQKRLRRVDVPGVDGSSVSVKAEGARKAAGAASAASVARGAAVTARAKAITARRDARYKVKSYKPGRAPQTRNFAGGVNGEVLELAGKFPSGQLAFRYKHGWILINPAIPSRGRSGGALARKHGVKSGSVTHGHFEPGPGGKGKVFVPDRHGGENNPAKLKAAHSKDPKANQSKYALVAAQKDSGGSALSPTVPTPEQVKAKKDAATKAAIIAQKSKSLADAQVAAKKYADAFVAQKKAGDTTGAEHSKNSAQAWAKKAAQIKQAEKASAEAKAKYEAEQKANAKAEAEAAAKKEAAQKKALDLMDKATELEDATKGMAEKSPYHLLAKAQQHKYAAEKWQELADHQKANGYTVGPQIQGKIDKNKALSEDFKKKAADKKKAIQEAQQFATDAYDASDDAKESQTAEDYKKAAYAHQKAGKAFGDLDMTSDQAIHFDKASSLMKKAHEVEAQEQALAKMTGAPKAESKPDVPPGIAKNTANMAKAEAISSVIDDLPEHVGGSLDKWDDYLHAAHAAKANPTPENLKALKGATEKLKGDGVELADIKDATSDLFKKAGFVKTAKKTVAQKKAAAAPEAPKAPEKKPLTDAEKKAGYLDAYKDLLADGNIEGAAKVKAGAIAKGLLSESDFPKSSEKTYTAEDFKVTLPGPGMYADGNAVTNAFKAVDAETDPAKKAAKLKAAENAVAAFKAKHGKEFDTSKVELMNSPVYTSSSPKVSSKEHPFWDTALAEGYVPIGFDESANDGWKPSSVPGLKSAKGGYTYSGGAYTAINSHLRGGLDPTKGNYAASIAQMDKEFAAVPGTSKDIVTIRKMNTKGPFNDAPPYMEPGGVFEDKGYSSTSKDPGAWSGNVVMQVRIPKGTKVLDLNHTTGSQNAHEMEILLNRGTKYKVVSDGPGHSGMGRLIVVEVVQ